VQKFKYKTVTSTQFKEFFIAHFSAIPSTASKLAEIDWQAWFYGPGMPSKPAFDTTLSAASEALATKWLHYSDATAFSSQDVAPWTSTQVVAMLESLLEQCHYRHQYLDPAVCQVLGDTYKLTSTKNAEIRMRYQTLCIRSEAAFILPAVEAFLKEQGRMKYVRPLFRDLLKSKFGRAAAKRVFDEAKHSYHPICAKMVEKDLATVA
jgi:leukotriene-A4 hydrolase